MIIRRVKKKDIDKLSVLFDKYRIFYKQQSDIDNAKSFLKKRMKRRESVIFVAEERKELIGFTQLFPIFSSVSMKRTWLLNDLYVNEKARGMGIASKLLEAAKEFGAETNSKWLILQTAADNLPHKKCMRKMVGKEKQTFSIERIFRTSLFSERTRASRLEWLTLQ